VFLCTGALALFAYQMHGLWTEYYSYPTKTTVSLELAPLLFPALTFCNMNPVTLFSLMKYAESRSN